MWKEWLNKPSLITNTVVQTQTKGLNNMSYEIVKTCRVVKKDDGFYYAVLKTASSNVYPRHYSEWNYREKCKLTKEELEKDLLLDFFHGNLQGGNSKYMVAARYCTKDYLQGYYKTDRVLDKVYELRYKLRSRLIELEEVEGQEERRKLIEKRMKELEKLSRVLYHKRNKRGEEGLYKYFKEGDMINIRGVILKTRGGLYTEYVNRVNKCSYRLTNRRTILTGRATVARVLNNKWWKENFDITVVYK